MRVIKEDLESVVESFLYYHLSKDSYKVEHHKGHSLLTWNRLDLIFKMLYLDLKCKNIDLAKDIYKASIYALTDGHFAEFGNKDKNSFQNYLDTFEDILQSISIKGFDESSTLIPLSKDKTILNGAHRVAVSIHLKVPVKCVELTEFSPYILDYNFFFKRKTPVEFIELAVNKFIESTNNVHIAFLWPAGKKNMKNYKLSESKFKNILYKKELTLSHNGANNLLIELYKHHEWSGRPENNFKGTFIKFMECFTQLKKFTVIVFQAENLNEVLELKEEIRKIHKIGYSSIHITDTKEEALEISRLIFNENGLHFLNYANPYKFLGFSKKINKFKEFIENNKISSEDIMINGDSILELYGIKESLCTDFFLEKKIKVIKEFSEFTRNDDEVKHHNRSVEELLYNPIKYFHYSGLKFISFKELYSMKKNKGREVDFNDCKKMEGIIKKHPFKFISIKIKQNMLYFKIRCPFILRECLKKGLKKLRLFNFSKMLFKKI